MPIRQGIAEQVYTVTSSDYMAIYAVNNLFKGILKYSGSGSALLGGIIGNSIGKLSHKDMINDFSEKTETNVIEFIPRSSTVKMCELDGVTTIEGLPNLNRPRYIDNWQEMSLQIKRLYIPKPFEAQDLSDWASSWVSNLIKEEKDSKEGDTK